MKPTNFDDFWTWLRTKQTAETLGGRANVSGQIKDESLVIMSSGGRKYRITRETAESYFREAKRNKFEGMTGNKRWVAALIRKFLET